jgi:hypothetical protein
MTLVLEVPDGAPSIDCLADHWTYRISRASRCLSRGAPKYISEALSRYYDSSLKIGL